MAFGVDYTGFLDSFNVDKVVGANNRERAKLKSQSFLTDSALGGKVTGIFGQNQADDVMAKAQASIQSKNQGASNIMGALDFAGNLGSFGAGGGFGGGGGVPGDGGAAAGLTTPWDKGYEFFKDSPSVMGKGFSIPSYDFTSPFTN